MAKVFVSRKIPGTALDKLKASKNEVEVSRFDRPLTAEELLEKGKGVDALLSLLTDKINGEVIDAIGPQLKIVSNYAVGFNNISVDEATERGVVITNTPSDEVNESVAEHSWALMLALARRIVEADEVIRRGAYAGWDPHIFIGINMTGKTLGIIGMGRIGVRCALRAKGWGMKVLYFKRTRDEKAEKELGVEYAELNDLLGKSDFVSLHVPLTDETRHMINKVTLSKMKRRSFLINTARGSVVDEHDLVDALRDGRLSGVGIDVFDNEPYINPELVGMENVVLTPHIASATWEAREKMGHQAVDSILAVLKGKKPENLVNEEVWEKRRE